MTDTAVQQGEVNVDAALVRRLANTVRGLSIDGVQNANSGHPGLPLGAADFAVTLWYHFLRFNPQDPRWPNRDKFILSAGHGSMLLYSLLHLAGYNMPMDELKSFRQFGSSTPGHPESFMADGIEATTGPLGQGFANGIGMALADKLLAARVNTPGAELIDCFVYALVSDGDLMEGVAQEAASYAGQLGLGNVIYLYDDNSISLDGPTELSYQEDTAKKFEAMNWHTITVDGHDPVAVASAISASQRVTDKPSLILCKTIIGYGSPNKANSSGVHGSPLGDEELKLTKENLGISPEAFHVPDEDRDAWAARVTELKGGYDQWQAKLSAARSSNADKVALLDAFFARELPADLESKLPVFDPAKPVATRTAGKTALQALGKELPWLVGGSADLSVSTNAIVSDDKVLEGEFGGRHIFFGVREHGMGGIVNGLTQHGAFRGFGSTFLTFSDYMRGSVRLSALSEIPAVWVYTHDSIFLGEDGPTHQPVEHYAALRSIPNLSVIRPSDATETAYAWLAALEDRTHPTALLLTRQNLPVLDRSTDEFAPASGLRQGAYILRRERDSKLDGILIGTGSEVQLCVGAAQLLEKDGFSVRVVSMPCQEYFDKQPDSYREEVLPTSCKARVAVEAGVSLGWHKYVGFEGKVIACDRFGASAPASRIAQEFGFTTENVATRLRSLLK